MEDLPTHSAFHSPFCQHSRIRAHAEHFALAPTHSAQTIGLFWLEAPWHGELLYFAGLVEIFLQGRKDKSDGKSLNERSSADNRKTPRIMKNIEYYF